MTAEIQSVTSSDLSEMEFEKLGWPVPGLISEGLTILAAPPKTGKSWLLLDITIGVASGTTALGGDLPCRQGNCLYAALEDDGRRIQSRERMALRGRPIPGDHMTYWFGMPRLNEGGLEAIEGWLEEENNPGMVVIDIYEQVRSSKRSYQEDYKAAEPLKRLAHKYHVAIVLVTHTTRKVNPEAPLDSVYPGISGSASTILIMNPGIDQGRDYVNMYVTGKDVESRHISLKYVGPGQLAMADGSGQLTETDVPRAETSTEAVLAVLSDRGRSTPAEITEVTHLKSEHVRQILFRLNKAGRVQKNGTRYSLPPKAWDEVTWKVTL